MTEYHVKWQACPHVQHPSRVLFVEAADEAAARLLAVDHNGAQYMSDQRSITVPGGMGSAGLMSWSVNQSIPYYNTL